MAKTYKKTNKKDEQGKWIIEVKQTTSRDDYEYKSPMQIEAEINELEVRIESLRDELIEINKLQ